MIAVKTNNWSFDVDGKPYSWSIRYEGYFDEEGQVFLVDVDAELTKALDRIGRGGGGHWLGFWNLDSPSIGTKSTRLTLPRVWKTGFTDSSVKLIAMRGT
jgi:hypothetical protein